MVYSLIARNVSNGKLTSLVSYPSDSLAEFFEFLNRHPFVIPDKYHAPEYDLYYNVDDVDDFEDVKKPPCGSHLILA